MSKDSKLYTYLQFKSSSINLSLSLKHCNEFMVDKTSGSKSSTVGITEVCNQSTKSVSHKTDLKVQINALSL